MRKRVFFIFFVIFFILLFNEVRGEVKKEIIIPFIEQEIFLDGNLNENVWKKAATLSNFSLAGFRKYSSPRPATQQTEVKIFYNTSYLCLGIIAYENQIDRINKGLPQEEGYTDVPLEWTGDELEIFLQPGRNGIVYHLAFNPNGAIWDSSSKEGVGWNGKWKVKTSIKKDRWIGEIKIDLTSISSRGEFRGTPNPGEVWYGNICRAEKPKGEFSMWSFSPTLFGNRDAFGKFVFKGRKETDPVVAGVQPGKLLFGKNVFKTVIKNPSEKKVNLECVLKLSGSEVVMSKKYKVLLPRKFEKEFYRNKIQIEGKKDYTLQIPYNIEKEGEQKLTFIINYPEYKTSIYKGSVVFVIYPLKSKIKEISDFINSVKDEIKMAKFTGDEKEIKDLFERLRGVEKEVKKIEEIIRKEEVTQEVISKGIKLENEVKNIKLVFFNKIRPIIYLKNNGKIESKFAIGIVPPSQKIFQDEPFEGKFSNSVKLSVARNEYESYQLVFLPVENLSEGIYLKTTDLKDKEGNIFPASNIKFHRVGYVHIKKAPVGTRGGYWPDPLYPCTSIKLEDKIQPVFITVYADKKQKPGLYTGILKFEDKKGKVVESMKIEVNVYPFTLPMLSDFKTDFWFDEWHINCQYDTVMTPEFFRKCMELLGKYHLAAYPTFRTIGRNLMIYLEPDGDLTFDFSKIDPYIQAAVDNGLTHINISFTNNYFHLERYFEEINVIERKTGKKLKLLVNNPRELTKKFLKDVYNHILEKGWFPPEKIYCDIADEPWNEVKKEELKKASDIVHSAIPGIKVYAAGTYPGMGVDGYIDVWAPQIRQFKPEDYTGKEELWWYQCLYKVPYPTFSINRPGLELRTLFWMCKKYNVTGFLYWTSIGWGSSKMISQGVFKNNRWVNPDWPIIFDGTDCPGDGIFFYPMPYGLIPNIRAVNIRDGIDDWEYLNILSKEYKKLKSSGVKIPEKMEEEITELIKVPKTVVVSPRRYTNRIEVIQNMREKVAEKIIEIEKLLK